MDAEESSSATSNPAIAREHPIFRYLMGNVSGLNDFLKDKHILLQLPNWALRAIGAPIFLNNPISGFIIFIAIVTSSPWVAINGLLGLFSAMAVALITQQDRGAISSGGATFHGLLIGVTLPAVINKQAWYPWIIFPVIILAGMSANVASGLAHLFGKAKLPCFNLPFVIISFVFLASCGSSKNAYFPLPPAPPPPTVINGTIINVPIDWGRIWLAIPNSMSQIYGCGTVHGGLLVLVATMICSPILFIEAVLGAFISVLIALSIDTNWHSIENGSWSFNAVLTIMSLNFFLVPGRFTQMLGIGASIFATYMFGALSNWMAPLPALAFPFVITSSIFLSFTTGSKYLIRVWSPTSPEIHILQSRYNTVNPTQNDIELDNQDGNAKNYANHNSPE